MRPLDVGDEVVKDSGDYTYKGTIVSKFTKKSGAVRFVVENDDGLLFIFNQGQIRLQEGS